MDHRFAAAALVALATLAGCVAPPPATGKRSLMLVGNDEKVSWNDAGAVVLGPQGRDSIAVIDIGSDPLAPRTVATLPLTNSIFGPPTNLAITPDEGLALVANSVNIVEEGGTLKQQPDNRLWVIDLQANPPKLIDTVAVGKQPSGLSINRAGTSPGRRSSSSTPSRWASRSRTSRSLPTASARSRRSSPATRLPSSTWPARR